MDVGSWNGPRADGRYPGALDGPSPNVREVLKSVQSSRPINAALDNPARTAVIAVGVGLIGFSQVLKPSALSLFGGMFMVTLSGLLFGLEEIVFSFKDGFRATPRPQQVPERAAPSTRTVEETSRELQEGEPVTLDQEEIKEVPSVLAADASLTTLLAWPDDGVIAGASLHLYVFDVDRQALAPIFEHDPNPLNSWPVGRGAVGICYDTEEVIVLEHADLANGGSGQSNEQAAYYADRTAVIAVPVLNRARQLLAVLSASTSLPEPFPTIDVKEEAVDRLTVIAAAVARVLVDLLHWYSDASLEENG